MATACKVTVSATDAEWHESFELVAMLDSWSLSHRSGDPMASNIEGETVRDDLGNRRQRLAMKFFLDNQALQIINVGSSIKIDMTASEAVARRWAEVSEYMNLTIE